MSKKRAFVRRKVKYSSVSSPVLLRSGAIGNPAREKTRSDGAEVAVEAKSFLADDLSVALRFPIGAGSSSSDKSITEPGMAELLVSKK